jgi:hypothetical protein
MKLQNRVAVGNYDQRDIDDAIVALQQVVNTNPMSDHLRDYLTNDLNRMREWR